MNRRQKTILTEFLLVVAVTALAVLAMINFKDLINRSEALRAMEQLGQTLLHYRQQHGAVPPEAFIDNIKDDLEGGARLGKIEYRGIWIDLDSAPDEILAYAYKDYHTLLAEKGYVVLRLGGRVEWMNKTEFETLLASQQSLEELQLQH
jgi:hypothetical protein